jgi:proteasome lid subunit RPN8/RPN11
MKNKLNLIKNPLTSVRRLKQPMLRFNPTAWAKLLHLRDAGPTEVGGFGIATTDDPLLVADVCLVEQYCSSVSVAFEDQAVAEFFDQQVDLGRCPTQFARIWIHTHPGDSPVPSFTDEETFARVFGATDWAVMFILARGGQTYCRLQYHIGPGGAMELAVQVEYQQPFAASDHTAWLAEHQTKVHELVAIGEIKELAGLNIARYPNDRQRQHRAVSLGADDWDDTACVVSEEEQAWEEYLQTYEDYAYEYVDR